MPPSDEIEEVDPMNPEAWYAEPKVCGSCIAWRPEPPRPGETVASGSCRLRKELPRVPATLRMCDLYKGRGKFVFQAGQEAPKRRKKASAVTVTRREGNELVTLKVPARAARAEPDPDRDWEAVEEPTEPYVPTPRRAVKLVSPVVKPSSVDVGTDSPPLLRQVFRDVIREELGKSGREILPRFQNGTVEVVDKNGKRRSFPISPLFSMLDRLQSSFNELEDAMARTDALLEQLPEIQKQIGAMKGSFTTFNLLFSDKADYFGA